MVDIENLRVDLGSYFQRCQAIDFWGKAFRKNTMAKKGYINKNSTGVRKKMGERETEIERKREKNRNRKWVARRQGHCISKDEPTSSTPLLITFLQRWETNQPVVQWPLEATLHCTNHICDLLQPKLRIKRYGTALLILQGRVHKHFKPNHSVFTGAAYLLKARTCTAVIRTSLFDYLVLQHLFL